MNFDMSNQNNNGLLRFRSAPSSALQSLINDIEKPRDLNDGLSYNNLISQSFQDLQKEVDTKPDLVNGYSLNSHLPPYYPRQSTSPSSMDSTSSYSTRGLSSSMGSSLLRQNSSPAGLFSHLNHQNGYGGVRGAVGSYRRPGNVANNVDVSSSSGNRLKRQISLSSGVTSSLGILPRISEVEPSVLNDATDYAFGSWEHESSHFIENFTELKQELIDDDDDRLLGGPQNVDNVSNHPPMLSHHLSLPKTSGEMAAVNKLIRFQDSVPCKIRAKRGCATHPRSIAERMRRTRISERMRKLQDLVPHMDKQTNTSDMLDLAVDYIKELQEQYKTLKEFRANCKCSAKSSQN